MARSCGFFNRWVGFLALLLIFVESAQGQTQRRSEREVKALFFVTLARYAEWPAAAFASDSAPIVIGVLGPDPFRDLLESYTEKEQVRGRNLKVMRFASADEIKECHLLFFGEMSPLRQELELAKLRARPILTVSAAENFTRRGGMIELYLNEDRKVRLKVAKNTLKNAGLAISPALLRLAEFVASIEYVPGPPEQLLACEDRWYFALSKLIKPSRGSTQFAAFSP